MVDKVPRAQAERKRKGTMNTQVFLTDLHEAAVAQYAGYAVRWLPNERRWAVKDPGDLSELLSDVRAGAQTISNALAFLKVYDEMRITSGQSSPKPPAVTAPAVTTHGESTVLRPTIRASNGRRWYTKDLKTAILLTYAGYELLTAEDRNGFAVFWFAQDDELENLIDSFNHRELLIEPRAFHDAGFQIRKAIREVKGYN
jgi:hypothetical protein